ncbi:hypothetical protein HanRHA438_Chr00c03g0844801 [Helianthus annuus]|uniref:Uncharacterized protein n=1 Tax=Helianthus annuus TaxID=4232 RepID=A0A9K3JFQ9_HELAN|nr:hypothetical protein HanXRQr2_Chr03g0106991 [Helianthus annuus]KAF5814128.1 hypothetical protein HanXRQr2_Chr03g0107001 [Helianthus annuus]KAJ0592800.1 hypothetical protein HanHA300_Chr03g0089341 [Helianthus annuus]KAJ0607800.1 hypothetical protein HanHA89_Chr03g0100951 [Helianthus annuus]KAJ0767865.1 hypothetical protein HanLR1_Chr03g0094331 [Helianthus annuus]
MRLEYAVDVLVYTTFYVWSSSSTNGLVNPQFRRLGESERARVHVMSYQTLPLACSNAFSPKFVVLVLSSILSNES